MSIIKFQMWTFYSKNEEHQQWTMAIEFTRPLYVSNERQSHQRKAKEVVVSENYQENILITWDTQEK